MKKSTKRPQRLSVKIVNVLVTYAKTQLLLVVLVTLVSWFILTKLGVQFALLLALITGAVSIVPILGITTAAIIASIVAIFDAIRFLPSVPSILEGIVVLVIYVLMNIAIDYFLSPYLIGKRTNVHPALLLVCILLGTSVFGVWGALLTVPAVLVVKTVSEHRFS